MNHGWTNRILDLLNQKNHYLEKFYALNESEYINFSAGRFDNLDYFYNTRERILEVIKYIDAEVSDEMSKVEEVNDEDKAAIQAAILTKEQYVGRILAQDIDILAAIDDAKSDIIRELQDLKKNKAAVSRYKSPVFDNRLDEEA